MVRHPDIAVVLLDVVMETDTAGLDLVRYIRQELKNDIVRIILRTGQPGQAPERGVIVDYDINDYKAKTELTAVKLFTALTAALRSYQQLQRMVETRRGLEIIIDATATLGDLKSIHRLAEGILTQMACLLDVDCAGILVLRENRSSACPFAILAGSGRYRDLVGRGAGEHLEQELLEIIEQAFSTRHTEFSRERSVLYIGSESDTEIVVVLDSRKHMSSTDRALLGIFCNRLSASIDNLVLFDKLQEANRMLEQRVAARTAELGAANRRLQDQWQRARRAKAFQSEILGTVAHDLKNPLTVVLGRTEILAQLMGRPPLFPDRCLLQLDHLKQAAVRMTGMVDMLVADAMADALDITIRPEPGDLLDLLYDIVEANRPLAERKGQRIAMHAAPTPARFDQDRMRDALDNLVSNAIKYSPLGAEITTSIERDGEAGMIRVEDRGPGLLPEDFSRLFGRFQRLSAKPTGGESSTGLGLFSAKRIVELHGGTIEVHSGGPGQGATFTICLPIDV
jgi:signal transduction histidine kinase